MMEILAVGSTNRHVKEANYVLEEWVTYYDVKVKLTLTSPATLRVSAYNTQNSTVNTLKDFGFVSYPAGDTLLPLGTVKGRIGVKFEFQEVRTFVNPNVGYTSSYDNNIAYATATLVYSDAPGSPSSPFTSEAQRTAWATANLATLRSGVSTVWGPGNVEYVWNGPLATDWAICRSGESFVLGTLVQILQLTPDANTVGIVSDVAGCVLQYNGSKWVGFIGYLTTEQSAAVDALGSLASVESGKINAVSSIDPNWPNWSSIVYDFGLDHNVDRTWHHFTGPIETDSMISVLGGKGRWHDAFEDGGHLFEGWNASNTERLTLIIGKVLHTASIFVFNPNTGGFETIQIGSDVVGKGVLFGPDNMILPGRVAMRTTGDVHVALNSQTGKGWELCGGSAGGGGTRNGPGIRAFGLLTNYPDSAGKLELFIGAFTGSLLKEKYGLYVKSQTNNETKDVFSVDGYGVARFLTTNPVVSTPFTPSSEASPGEKGTIAWDTHYIYVCIATNTWKRCAIATW